MKLKNIINLFAVAALLFITACNPVVDEEHLKNNTTVDGVELIATQNAQGGNTIELKMNTPGVTGYWDYNLGRAFTDRIEIVYPIPGTSTFTFTGTLGAEFFTKTIDVTVNVLDTPLEQDWYDLVSEDTAGGKSWVYTATQNSGTPFYYMSPPGNPDSWATIWWDAGNDWNGPSDGAGKMHFDLDGAANYTYYVDAAGDVSETGSFVLDTTNKKLRIVGSNILGAGSNGQFCGQNPTQEFDIISLTEDELILYYGAAGCGSGWTYIFKPEE